MADVQLADFGNCCDGTNGLVTQSVARVNFEPERSTAVRRVANKRQLAVTFFRVPACRSTAPGSGVKLDDGRAHGACRLDLPCIGFDEERRANTRFSGRV